MNYLVKELNNIEKNTLKNKSYEKVVKYINNNIVEFRAIIDTLILAGAFWLAAIACKFILLYFA